MRKSARLYITILVAIIFVFFQDFSSFSQNAKAKVLYDKATQQLGERKQDEATATLLKALEIEPNYAEVYFKLGQISESNRNAERAISFYEKAIAIKANEPSFTQAYTYIGTRALKAGQYEKAKAYLSFSLKNSLSKSLIINQLNKQLSTCDFAIEMMKKPLQIKANEVDKKVNRQVYQYFPVLTADNESLIFTARSEKEDENLYISKFQNGYWTDPESLSPKINTGNNEGTCSISADGRILVFTSCENESGLGSCDLYISKKIGEEWSKPENLGDKINSRHWESQPSLSSDGRVLYFSSDRPMGYGHKDLYMSELDENGNWAKAINLGMNINTMGDEISPFIHANGRTLFFASDGHTGMGGFDIFLTENKANSFIKPENLGYPINTADDQVAMFITADGKKAYYSLTEKNATKLYQFDVPKELSDKFKRANFVKGIVTDKQTKKVLRADIELFDIKTNTLITKIQSDSLNGEYTAVLPNGSNYALYVNSKGYFFKSLAFDFSEKTDAEGKHLDIALEPIRKDAKEVLNNIFFDSGKAELKPESLSELEKLSKLLKQNPNLSVEISGHTDDVGKDSDNQILSQKRAQSVVDYLSKNGANILNIRALGYGETRPILPNTNEENRQQNRRIEMKIL